MWKTIEDKNIRHRWECPDCDCDEHVYVEPWFYSEMGQPFCTECEVEMEYIRTECNHNET